MAIKNIPQISGPNYGGVIYGLSMNIGYSNEPSKLVIDIVNKDGNYSPPSLNSSASISFGNFRFNGFVWSHSIKEMAGEKTLQVTIIDKSIILDRHYVLLWKRGLLGLNGSATADVKTFDFSDESILVPVPNTSFAGFPVTKFQEKILGIESIPNVKKYILPAAKKGNILLVGREKLGNGTCDIPDTYYYFNDLKRVLPVNGNLPSDAEWKATHEGTLREVLSNWASDLGYDFYWDFSSDRINFYEAEEGITSVLENVSSPNIISKETSKSLEGTFRQYGLSYIAMPKESIKELNESQTNTILYTVSPIDISYFARRIGSPQSYGISRDIWGKDRNREEFLTAASVGFVSRALRDIYSFQQKHWEALGYGKEYLPITNKTPILNILKKTGYGPMIANLEAFDQKDLPNYNFTLISYDQGLADKWNEVEQLLLTYQGKYYRISDTSGSFFYCSSRTVAEIVISVEPGGGETEDANVNFSGKKIFSRDGKFSHDASSAQEALGYKDLASDIQNCAPVSLNLREAGLYDRFISAGILPKNSTMNSLIIHPKNEEFIEKKIGFSADMSRGNHPLEMNTNDISTANIQSGRKNCPNFEKYADQNTCKSYEEMARQKAIKRLRGGTTVNPDNFVTGLSTTTAKKCKIKLKTGSIDLYSPSDGRYQVICRYDISIRILTSLATEQFIYSVGDTGIANDVAEIRVINENVTDPEEDSFQKPRRSALIPVPRVINATTPATSVKYTFAGEPDIPLSIRDGLTNLDVSLSSDGFTTTAVFTTRAPKPAKANNILRYVHSQFNRAGYNAS